MARELVDGRLGEGPGRHDVDPSAEVPGHVGDRLAPSEPDVLAREVHGGPSELGHAHLEGDPGAERRLLEDQRQE